MLKCFKNYMELSSSLFILHHKTLLFQIDCSRPNAMDTCRKTFAARRRSNAVLTMLVMSIVINERVTFWR